VEDEGVDGGEHPSEVEECATGGRGWQWGDES
jgi:hypothetical protein